MDRTRIVRLLQVILPLLALGLLSGLFLLGRDDDERTIPYATGEAAPDVAAGIVAPTYTAVSDDGAQIRFHAQAVTPAAGNKGTASGVSLDWRTRDGLSLALTAGSGGIAGAAITLDGGVRLTSSTGYRVETGSMTADTRAGVLKADRAVTADAPFGQLTAGGMRLARQDAGHVLDFTGGVRLLYRP